MQTCSLSGLQNWLSFHFRNSIWFFLNWHPVFCTATPQLSRSWLSSVGVSQAYAFPWAYCVCCLLEIPPFLLGCGTVVTLNQWWVNFAQRIFGKVWRFVWLPQLPGGRWGNRCSRHLVGRGQGCYSTSHDAQDSLPQLRFILLKMSIVLQLGNCVLNCKADGKKP